MGWESERSRHEGERRFIKDNNGNPNKFLFIDKITFNDLRHISIIGRDENYIPKEVYITDDYAEELTPEIVSFLNNKISEMKVKEESE